MKKFFISFSFLILVAAIGCKKDSTTGNGPTGPGNTAGNTLELRTNTVFGQYLATSQGLTLYMFANDADGASTCAGGCSTIWKAYTTADITKATFDAGLSAADFSTLAGTNQVTFKGWPLYTYSPAQTGGYGTEGNVPEGAGLTGGDGVDGMWFIAKIDYTIMLANKQLTGADGINYKSDYTVGTGNTMYFTTAAGKTLYTFAVDSFNINKFTKPDLSNDAQFPIYQQQTIVVPSVLDKALFGTITVAGKTQMTYKGWPLYNFGADADRGSNKAVSVPQVAIWPVAVKGVAEASKP